MFGEIGVSLEAVGDDTGIRTLDLREVTGEQFATNQTVELRTGD